MKPHHRTAIAIVGILMLTYVAGYGLARWRKLLIREKWVCKGGGPSFSRIVAGADFRTTGAGAFKNAIAKPVASFYLPMCVTEGIFTGVGGGLSPIEAIRFVKSGDMSGHAYP